MGRPPKYKSKEEQQEARSERGIQGAVVSESLLKTLFKSDALIQP